MLWSSSKDCILSLEQFKLCLSRIETFNLLKYQHSLIEPNMCWEGVKLLTNLFCAQNNIEIPQWLVRVKTGPSPGGKFHFNQWVNVKFVNALIQVFYRILNTNWSTLTLSFNTIGQLEEQKGTSRIIYHQIILVSYQIERLTLKMFNFHSYM